MFWAARCLRRMDEEKLATGLLESLKRGVRLSTDYSGMGCPEMSMENIISAAANHFGHHESLNFNVVCHRAADIEDHARKVLLSRSGPTTPMHVFGDICERIPAAALTDMNALQRQAEKRLQAIRRRGCEEGVREDPKIIKALGAKLRKDCEEVMKCVEIDQDRVAKCYKHPGKACRVAPPRPRPGDRNWIDMVIAGVTCTDYSSMGDHKGNVGRSIIVFHAFAAQTLADEPTFVLLECTKRFDTSNLKLFTPKYTIRHLQMCPCDLGIPTRRVRKFMLMAHIHKARAQMPFDIELIGKLFFCNVQMSPGLYMHVSDDFRQNGAIESFRKQRGFVRTGRPFRLSVVLPAGFLRSMELYADQARALQLPDGFVNIGQTPEFTTHEIPQVIPTLLKGSLIVSLARKQMFEYPEYLAVMGISNPLLRASGVTGVA